MQLTSESVMEAVEREECWVVKERASTFFAGPSDSRCGDTHNGESDALDNTNGSSVHF